MIYHSAKTMQKLNRLIKGVYHMPKKDKRKIVVRDVPLARTDDVNHPPHYTQGIECIEYIESHDMNYNEGNVIKYVTRYKYKGTPLKDLQKAQWYLNRVIKSLERQGETHGQQQQLTTSKKNKVSTKKKDRKPRRKTKPRVSQRPMDHVQ